MKWKKESFDRIVRDDDTGIYNPKTTPGYTYGNFGIHKSRFSWSITHLPSGYLMNSRIMIERLKQAKAIVELAEQRFDWSIPQEEISNNEEMREFARNPGGLK